jgi:hypothetical protein
MDSASAIEDPTNLADETLHNQDGTKIGKIKHVYGVGEGQEPMWITVAIETGTGRHQLVFVPLARLKHERDQIRVPYTAQHLLESPEVEADGELSESDELALRNYYAIGLGDQEVRSDNETYAAQIPDAEGSARKIAGED